MSSHAASHLPLLCFTFHYCINTYEGKASSGHYLQPLPLLVLKDLPCQLPIFIQNSGRELEKQPSSAQSTQEMQSIRHSPSPCAAPRQREAKTQGENISTPRLREDQIRHIHVLPRGCLHSRSSKRKESFLSGPQAHRCFRVCFPHGSPPVSRCLQKCARHPPIVPMKRSSK